MNAGHRVSISIDEATQMLALRTEPLEQPDIFSQHLLHVVRLQDQLVRAALVKLGWTPPEAKPPVDTLIVDWLESRTRGYGDATVIALTEVLPGATLRDAVIRQIEGS